MLTTKTLIMIPRTECKMMRRILRAPSKTSMKTLVTVKRKRIRIIVTILWLVPSINQPKAIRGNIKIAQKIKLIWICFRSMLACHLSNAINNLTFLKNYKIKNQITLHNHLLIIRIYLISRSRQ